MMGFIINGISGWQMFPYTWLADVHICCIQEGHMWTCAAHYNQPNIVDHPEEYKWK